MINLLNNYFTLSTQNETTKDSEGAVYRGKGSIFPIHKNIQCAIQGINKLNIEEIYGKEAFGADHIVFLQDITVHNDTEPGHFIFTNANPRMIITDYNDKTIKVYKVVGKRDPVMHISDLKCLSIFVQFTERDRI